MNRLQRFEKSLVSQNAQVPFGVGDTVRVHVKVIEGGKERVQVFEGVVIARSGEATRETFTVRKVSYNTGVERIFPIHSPKIAKIELARSGRVRRAKLYYLRSRRGKAARIAEKDMRGKNAAAASKAAAAAEAAAVAEAAAAEAAAAEAEAAQAKAEEAVAEEPVEAVETAAVTEAAAEGDEDASEPKG